MTIKEPKLGSCRTRTPLTANPSYRRTALSDIPKRNPWNNIISTTLELLLAISITNDNECAENVDGNISFESKTVDTPTDGVRSSSTDKSQGIISSQTTNDKTYNHSTIAITTASPIVPLETITDHSTAARTPLSSTVPLELTVKHNITSSSTVPLETTVNHSTTSITPASTIVRLESKESRKYIPSSSTQHETSENQSLSLSNQFKSYLPDISTQQDIDDELGLALSYQYMFDKRTSPWEMKDWDQEELNDFVIQPEMIDRLYHMIANNEDQNFRSWEICCRMEYKGEKYFVEMYANCDYTGFDCQGGGQICITKLPDFFLENMVTTDQNPDQIYRALLEDGYNVQEPDPLQKMHPKFWNNAPMLKYLCHNAIYKNKSILSHFKEQLPPILANSVDDFIKVKEWEYE